MSLIFDIFMTIFIIIISIRIYDDYYAGYFIISRIFVILIEQSLFTVLMIYNKRVKSLFKEINSFLNDFPNEIQAQ